MSGGWKGLDENRQDQSIITVRFNMKISYEEILNWSGKKAKYYWEIFGLFYFAVNL